MYLCLQRATLFIFKMSISRYRSLCMIVLAWFCLAAGTAFSMPQNDGKKTRAERDSMNILDSLVYKTRVINAENSQKYARRALVLAKKRKKGEDIVKAYMLLGIAFTQDHKDSSYYYDNLALKMADSLKIQTEKPILIYNLAALNSLAYDYKTALVFLDSAIKVSEISKNYGVMSQSYNLMGNIKNEIQDIASSRQNYETALKIARDHSLYKQMGVALSNLGRIEEKHDKAIPFLKEAIVCLGKGLDTYEEMANAYINIGYAEQNPDSALFYYKKALEIAKSGNLPDVEIAAYNNMAYSYLDKNDIRSAESALVDHAIPQAQNGHFSDWLSELCDSYAFILTYKGDYKNANIWQKKALEEKRNADEKQASSQLRLLSVLLDTKNKELTIQTKERELLAQKNRLQTTRLWLLISGFLIIGFIFLIYFLQQRSRARLNQEQITSAKRIIEMEESEKGRTARELHDITGQLVMGITGSLENIEFPDPAIKEDIRTKIKDLSRSIRLISHRMNRAMLDTFTFEELMIGQCEDVQKLSGIPIHLTLPPDPITLPEEVVLHIHRIIQELLTNATKYATGGEVWITLQKKETSLSISYQDTGPGFDSHGMAKKGMGLMNIYERTKLLGGEASVDSSPGDGTSWQISIPLTR